MNNNNSNKSLDELLSKKCNDASEKKSEKQDDIRSRMNRQINANKVLQDDVFSNDFEEKLLAITKEKEEIEKSLDEATNKLAKLYELKINDLNIIDKESDNLSPSFINAVSNENKAQDQASIKALEETIKSLDKELDKAKEDLDNLKQTNNLNISEIKERLHLKEDELALANKKLVKLETEKETLKQTLAQTKKELNKEIKQGIKDSSEDKLNLEINALKDKLSQKEKELTSLSLLYQDSQKSLINAKDELAKANTNASLNDQILKKDNRLQELENENKNLKLQANNVSKLSSELRQSYIALDTQEKVLAKQETIISKMQYIIDNKLQEYKNAEDTYLKEKHVYNERKELIDKKEDEIIYLKFQIDKLSNALDECKQNNDESNSVKDNISKDFEEYKITKENELKSLKQENSDLSSKLLILNDSLNVTKNDLDQAIQNENTLNIQIKELEEKNQVLANNVNNNDYLLLKEKQEKYQNLLTEERQNHEKSEKHLANELSIANKNLNAASEKLVHLSSNYLLGSLNKQVNNINDILSAIRDKGSIVNRDKYYDYYEKLMSDYKNTISTYQKEVSKRNDFIQAYKDSLIEKLKNYKENNNANRLEVSSLECQIGEIDDLLDKKIIDNVPKTSKEIEEELLNKFKRDLLEIHREMEENIAIVSKHITDKYKNISSIDSLLKAYQKDSEEMSELYADEISRLNALNKFEDNCISKLLREEKIILLVGEFENLIHFRDQTYQTSEQRIKEQLKQSHNIELQDELTLIDKRKEEINISINALKKEYDENRKLIIGELNALNTENSDLNKKLHALASSKLKHKNFDKDLLRINQLLNKNKDRENYLKTVKAKALEDEYNKNLSALKDEFDKLIIEESDSNNIFDMRINAISNNEKNKLLIRANALKTKSIENINQHLLNLNTIESVYNDVIKRRNDSNIKNNGKITIQDQKLKNLWALYDSYVANKQRMEEDFEDIRIYNDLKLQTSGLNKKYQALLKEINQISNDLKIVNDKKALALTYKNKIDFNTNQIISLEHKQNVSEYIKLCNAIKKIIVEIKNMKEE